MKYISPGRTLHVLILLEILVLFNFSVTAQENTERGALDAAIYPTYENQFRVFVRLDNPRRRLVWVRVRNDKKENLFVDWTKKFKYNVKLNLEELPNGEYWVEVTDGRKVITKVVHIRTLYEQRTQRIVSLTD
jgi:hypothetical protein